MANNNDNDGSTRRTTSMPSIDIKSTGSSGSGGQGQSSQLQVVTNTDMIILEVIVTPPSQQQSGGKATSKLIPCTKLSALVSPVLAQVC